MTSEKSTWKSEFLDSERLTGYIDSSLVRAAGAVHLAVFCEPFLTLLLDGVKTLESRFSRILQAPYQRVANGDLVFVKASGGPVLGAFVIESVDFYRLNPGVIGSLKQYSNELCVDESFWADRANSAFATLMRVGQAQRIPAIVCAKQDRLGWVVLRERPHQLEFEY